MDIYVLLPLTLTLSFKVKIPKEKLETCDPFKHVTRALQKMYVPVFNSFGYMLYMQYSEYKKE